jgi:hypothetical protein
VTLRNVIINAPGNEGDTINLANVAPFNGSRTLASLAPITRADGSPLYVNVRPTVDSAGNVQRIPTAANQLVIDGRNPTLDVRAGIDWSRLGGLPVNGSLPTPLPNSAPSPNQPTFTAPTSANITVNSIQVNGVFGSDSSTPGNPGVILLTNQYKPNNALAGGTIQVVGTIPTGVPGTSIRCVDCSTSDRFSDSVVGTLALDSRSDVDLGNVEAISSRDAASEGGTNEINVDLAAIRNITTDAIAAKGSFAGGGGSGSSSVVLRSTTGDIRVSTIAAGDNGVDISAAGLFQATGVSAARFSFLGNSSVSSSTPGTPLYDFLIAKGVPKTEIFDSARVRYDTSLYQNSSIRLISTGNPVVTIQYGDASRTLVNTNTTNGVRVVVRGGDAAFSLGPGVSGSLISGQDPYALGGSTSGNVQYQTVTAQNYNQNELYFNQQYTSLVFGSAAFAVDASGLVGGITLTGGTNSTLGGSTQNLSFSAIPKPANPVSSIDPTKPANPVSPIDPTKPTNPQPPLGEAGQVAQQVLNKQGQNTSCEATSTIAAVPSATSSVTDTRSPRTTTAANAPCASAAQDDAQILKILGE